MARVEPLARDMDTDKPIILVVDDGPAVRDALKFSLELEGLTVHTCGSGMALLNHPDLEQAGCIVLDYKMPEMDGYEATVLLRKRGETLPIIALTASTPKEVESEALAAGLTDIVVKPFNPDDLYRVILLYASPSAH